MEKKNSVTGFPKHLQSRQSEVQLSYKIRSVPYLTHNVTNKNFDRLAMLYKNISQNSKIIQLNHISKYYQIMKI